MALMSSAILTNHFVLRPTRWQHIASSHQQPFPLIPMHNTRSAVIPLPPTQSRIFKFRLECFRLFVRPSRGALRVDPVLSVSHAVRAVSALHHQHSDLSNARSYGYGQPSSHDYGACYPSVPVSGKAAYTGSNQYSFGTSAAEPSAFGWPVISIAPHRMTCSLGSCSTRNPRYLDPSQGASLYCIYAHSGDGLLITSNAPRSDVWRHAFTRAKLGTLETRHAGKFCEPHCFERQNLIVYHHIGYTIRRPSTVTATHTTAMYANLCDASQLFNETLQSKTTTQPWLKQLAEVDKVRSLGLAMRLVVGSLLDRTPSAERRRGECAESSYAEYGCDIFGRWNPYTCKCIDLVSQLKCRTNEWCVESDYGSSRC